MAGPVSRSQVKSTNCPVMEISILGFWLVERDRKFVLGAPNRMFIVSQRLCVTGIHRMGLDR